MFWAEIWKISEFLSENFQFLVVKFSIYLNRRVFVMYFMDKYLELWQLHLATPPSSSSINKIHGKLKELYKEIRIQCKCNHQRYRSACAALVNLSLYLSPASRLDENLLRSNLTLVLLNPDIPCICKQYGSRSVGFWWSQLIWICTVCH